jgi:hypothetical protein
MLAFPAFGPDRLANIVKYAGGRDLSRTPPSTCTLCFVEWPPDDHMILQRNQDYGGVWSRCPGGLPIGMQVVAHPWREDVALAVAERVEKVLGGWRPPPI